MTNDVSVNAISRSFIRSLCEGLIGYLTYESRCGMGGAMCEAILYPPALRIAKHLGWSARVEFPTARALPDGLGDFPRVDLVARRDTTFVAIEFKWFDANGTMPRFSDKEKNKLKHLARVTKRGGFKNYYGYQLLVGRCQLKKLGQSRRGSSPSLLQTTSGKLSPELHIEFAVSSLHYYAAAYNVTQS